MARMKQEIDLELSIGGEGALKGALRPQDLVDLGDLLKALKGFDPSLENIQMIGSIRKGSALTGFVAPHPEGMINVRPPRVAARAFFETAGYEEHIGWTWPREARLALDRITKRRSTLGVAIPASHPDESALKVRFNRQDFERFAKNVAGKLEWRTVKGRILEVDLKDRTFEVHTTRGQITCPFPSGWFQDEVSALLGEVVTADVLCRARPSSGPWKADECRTVLPVLGESVFIEEVQRTPRKALPTGIRPAKKPMQGGFHLAAFAPSLDGPAGESLSEFLRDFEGE